MYIHRNGMEKLTKVQTGEPSLVSKDLLNLANKEIDSLRKQLIEKEKDINNAVREAKKYQPDYPWTYNTASEAVWACGTAYIGLNQTCEDLEKQIAALLKEKNT
jgi:hypothetical protein